MTTILEVVLGIGDIELPAVAVFFNKRGPAGFPCGRVTQMAVGRLQFRVLLRGSQMARGQRPGRELDEPGGF